MAKEFKLKEKHILFIMFITALHPTLIILSGSVNNDCLSVTMIMWSILRLIKWYKKPNAKNTVWIGIVTGLAVMAKTNAGIVAIPIIYIFILRLYRELKKSENKKRIIKKYIYTFILFGSIALPIGLWYNIRNYILFDQPLLYVLDLKDMKLYRGNYSYFERFFPFSKEIFTMYAYPYLEHSVPIYLLKTSLFGEWEWGIDKISYICYIMAMIMGIIYTITSIIYIAKSTVSRNKRHIVHKNMLIYLLIINLISFTIMNIKLPYGCSMDFRYIVPVIFIQGFIICFELEKMKNKNKAKKIFEVVSIIMIILLIASDYIILTWNIP